jgi:hypothetical protein
LEIETPILNIETEPQMKVLIHKGTFSMALKDVNDVIAQGNLHSEDTVLQLIDELIEAKQG